MLPADINSAKVESSSEAVSLRGMLADLGVDLPNLNSSWPLCHCVQHPWKLTSRDYWSSRNDRKPLLQQKCVLRKCCKESQKWWVLELSNLCHCVQHPWKFSSGDFWSSRNERVILPQDVSTGDRSASWSTYINCDNRNLKLPFFATYIRSVTIETSWNCHSEMATHWMWVGGYICWQI